MPPLALPQSRQTFGDRNGAKDTTSPTRSQDYGADEILKSLGGISILGLGDEARGGDGGGVEGTAARRRRRAAMGRMPVSMRGFSMKGFVNREALSIERLCQ